MDENAYVIKFSQDKTNFDSQVGMAMNQLEDLKKTASEATSMTYGEDVSRQIEVQEANLDRMLRLMDRLDSVSSTSQQEKQISQVQQSIQLSNTARNNLVKSITDNKGFEQSLGSAASSFMQAISSVERQLEQGLKTTAKKMAGTTGVRDLNTIVSSYMQSNAYSHLIDTV